MHGVVFCRCVFGRMTKSNQVVLGKVLAFVPMFG